MAKKKKTKKISKAKKISKRNITVAGNGKGWNKKANMSNNAVLAFKSGYITWDLFTERFYFIGNEITLLNNFISQLYIRHHIGDKMKETYMFDPNLLNIINSDNIMRTDYVCENYFNSNELTELKNTYNLRKFLINKTIEKIKNYNSNTSKMEIYNELNELRSKLIKTVTELGIKEKQKSTWASDLIFHEVCSHINFDVAAF